MTKEPLRTDSHNNMTKDGTHFHLTEVQENLDDLEDGTAWELNRLRREPPLGGGEEGDRP